MWTLYDDLGILQSASDQEVRRAYKRKALETHPDRLGPDASDKQRETARTRFQKIHEAFLVLGDPDKRKTYDTTSVKQAGNERAPTSDDQPEKMKDRSKWAHQQRMRDEERKNATRAKDEQLKIAQEKKTREAKMAREFLQELFSLNPEWEERRRRVNQRRAQRKEVNSKQHSLPT